MYSKIAILAAIGFTALRVARAEGLDWDEVPPQCFDACREVVELSQVCDDQHSDDSAELNCICVGENMDTFIPQCELCARPYFLDGPDDTWDDPFELLGDCGMPALEQDSPPGGGDGDSPPSSPSPAPPAPQPEDAVPPPTEPTPPTAPTDDTPDDTNDDDDYATPPPTGPPSTPETSPETSAPATYAGAAGAIATPMAGAAVLVALMAI